MILPTTFLVLSLIGLTASVISYFRLRLPGPLMIFEFFTGWIIGELALQVVAVQALATVLFVQAGVLDSTSGQVGLVATAVSWLLLGAAHRRAIGAGEEFRDALAPEGITPESDVSPVHGFLKPFGFRHPDVRVDRNIAYGEALPGDKGGRNLLDVYSPKDAAAGDRRPVLLQIHGGAWIIGDKREQAIPLMTHLASRGWICVSSNYRLSPKATMPDHIVDVKRAIAWIRSNIDAYGGDPNFVCITGGSAGGNLTALAALTANDPKFQPGLEEVDTRLEAAVPFYGVFDFLDRADDRGTRKMHDAIGPQVFKCTPDENPELWDAVSPITRVHSEAPPFLVIQGTHDSLVYAGEADTFVATLREKSVKPVLHAELKGAQHAFEMFHSVRSAHAVRGATAFLEKAYADYQAERGMT
jgi:acetyl esterase/lipase